MMTDIASRSPSAPVRLSGISLRAVQICVGVIPLLIVPGIDEYTLLPRLLLLQLAALAAALAWAFQVHARPPRRSPLHLPAAAFLLVMSASALWALNPFRSTYDLSKYLTLFLFFFILLHTLDRRHIPGILGASAIAGAFVSLIGIGEYLGFLPPFIPSTGRPSSTFGFRNLAASYLAANLPLAGLLFLISRSLRGRLLGGLSAALMLVFLLYTRGRGAWVGLFAATCFSFGVWAVFARKTLWESFKAAFDRPALIVAGVSFLLVIGLGPLSEGFRERHIQRFDEKKADIASAVASIVKKGGDRGRTVMWRNTLKMIRDNPLLGVGLGNWEYAYPPYDRGRMVQTGYNPLRPHNDPLWIWSEQGTFGLLAYLALPGVFLFLCVRIWRHAPAPRDRLTALSCSAALFAVVGDGCFGFPWERIPPTMLFWFALAVVGLLARRTRVSPAPICRPTRLWRWAVWPVPLLLLAGIGITIRNIGFDYYYIRTFLAFLRKDNPAIVREGERAIAFGPFDHQIFVMYGEGQLALKNYDRAEWSFRRCLAYHPYFANAYNNLGLLHDRMGNTEQALASYRRALEIVPRHQTASYNLGTVYQKMGLTDSAIVAYRRAYRPNHTRPYVNLGGVYRKMGLIDSAIVVYELALSGDPPAIEAYYNLGNIYTDRREYEKAIEAYSSFISLWKGDRKFIREAREGLGQAYSGLGVQAEGRGQIERALGIYQTALQHWPESALIWFNLGNVYRKKKAWDNAAHAYLKSLALDSTYVDAYNNLGMTYQDGGRHRQAVDVYRKALRFQPDQPILYYNLGNTYAELGDLPHALKAYRAFLKHWTGDPAVAATVRRMIGELDRR